MANDNIVVQKRSVSSLTRTNFLPIVQYKRHNAVNSKPYLDYLSAKYLQPLKSITEYTLYTIENGTAYRPELISEDLYGSQDYWWVICFYNKVIHPLRDLYPSRVLKIPSFSQVTKMFQKMSAKESNIGKIVSI